MARGLPLSQALIRQPDRVTRPVPKPLVSARTRRRIVQSLVLIAVFTVAFAVFWFILRRITADDVPPPDSGAVATRVTVARA